MTRNIKLTLFTAILLCFGTVQAQTQKNETDTDTETMILQWINEHLSNGNCEKAQKAYDSWKTYTDKTNSSVEKRIAECKGQPLEQGVVINGVCWATRNVAEPGTFADKPEDAGMFYQWNHRKAWPATGSVTGWDSSDASGSSWAKANDPSPAGWRVPTLAEIKKLLDTNKVRNEWTTVNGVYGRKFTDKTSGKSIFLPAAGYRSYYVGVLYYAGNYGYYWSSTQIDGYFACFLYFNSGNANWDYYYRSNGFSVRSVAEN